MTAPPVDARCDGDASAAVGYTFPSRSYRRPASTATGPGIGSGAQRCEAPASPSTSTASPDPGARSGTSGSSESPRYAHLVEEDVHPYQALCGWEWDGTQLGPEPPICPKCLDIYHGIAGPKEIER